MFAGLRPTFNVTNPVYASSGLVSSGNENVHRDWHRMTLLTDHSVAEVCAATLPLPVALAGALTPDTTSSVGSFAGAAPTSMSSAQAVDALVYPVPTKTLATVKITAHGISIYDQYQAEFFADYIPYQYGGYNIVTPEDVGAVKLHLQQKVTAKSVASVCGYTYARPSNCGKLVIA